MLAESSYQREFLVTRRKELSLSNRISGVSNLEFQHLTNQNQPRKLCGEKTAECLKDILRSQAFREEVPEGVPEIENPREAADQRKRCLFVFFDFPI